MRREGRVNNTFTNQTIKFCGCHTCGRDGAVARRRRGGGANVCNCEEKKAKRALKKDSIFVNLPPSSMQADHKVLMRKAKHRYGDNAQAE